jgi:hypothetical protein
MTDTKDQPPPKHDAKSARAERVAAALRENLRRRKEQARAREEQKEVLFCKKEPKNF